MNTDQDEDEIDLQIVAARIWNWRKFILTGTLIVIAIALVANEFFAKYQSEGYLKVSNLSPTSYRTYQPTFMNGNRFRAYAAEIGLKDDSAVDFVANLLSSRPEILEKSASFVRSVTPKDSKDNIISQGKDKDIATVYLGIELNIPGPNPEAAQSRSKIFSEYFIDSIMFADLVVWIDTAVLSREAASYSNKLATIQLKRSIDETEKRLDALRTLVKRYPDAARMETRQVLSIEKGGERFLSPVAQIVAAESSIVDAKIGLIALLRKQVQLDMKHEFYKQAAAARASTDSGRMFLEKLLVLRDGVSKKVPASDDISMEVVNEISLELEQRQVSYTTGFKFLFGPTLPENAAKKSPLLVALGAGVGGVFFMLILALLMSWWRQNGKFIKGDYSAMADAG